MSNLLGVGDDQSSVRDNLAASIGASSAVGFDQSIDTAQLGDFDWVEDVKKTPREDGSSSQRI